MKLSLPAFLALFALIPLALPTTVFNQTPSLVELEGRVTAVSNTGQRTEADLDEEEDDEQTDRVARLTFIEGDVSFLRAGTNEWADGAENIPLLTGDQIYTNRGARAEIQLSRGNYIRLSEQTSLTFTDFSDTTAQFEVTEGSILVRLERFGAAFNRFEVDTPNAAMLLKQDGFYRVNVRGDDFSEMIARDGSAEVTTDDGVFTVREGYRLVVDTSSNGKLDIARDSSRDQWEQWSYDRDTTIDRITVNLAPDYVRSYETTYNSFYGASDLYDYGTWTSYGSYGHCWVPRVSSGWAPYRNGQWIWLSRSGWTWWSREPWGWAPYHHGRWVFINGLGWAWSPGFHQGFNRYNHRYYRWRPALVSFFNCPTPRGHYVGWYPLRPGERWRRFDHNRNDHSHLQYPGGNGSRRPQSNDNWRRPIARDGITTIPVDGFARPDRSRSRPEAPDRDVDRWVKDGARPGLPDMGTGGWVTSPVARSADGQPRAKRGITPPQEIINRPVVTRNRPSDSNDGSRPGRQRRLLTPRDGTVIAAPGARRSRTSDDDHSNDSAKKGNEDSNGKNNRPSIRPRRDDSGGSSNGHNSGDDSTRRRSNDDSNGGNNQSGEDSNRRRSRDNDNNSGDSNKNRSNRDNGSNDPKDKEPRRYVPAPKQDNDAGNNNSDRNREKRSRDNEGSRNTEQPRRIDSPRNNNDGGSRTRSNDQPKSSDRPNSGRQDSRPPDRGGDRKKGNG